MIKAITKMAVRPDKTEEFERLTEEEPVIEVYTELADSPYLIFIVIIREV